MGAGAVGGYFGARLAAGGDEVTFIARGAQKEAMERDGLRILSPLGDLHIETPEVVADPVDAGFFDIILFCVKLWDVAAAAETIRPLLSRDSAVIPLQNGVTVEDQLAELLGPQHILGGVTAIGAIIEKPGVIRHYGNFARLIFGERDGAQSWRQECLLSACIGAGIEARVSDDIEVDIWEKFVALAPLAGATSFYRAPLGEILHEPARRVRFEALVHEVVAVGRAKGVALDETAAARAIAFAESMPPALKASMANDLDAGRRLELDWLNGEVVRLGQALGVETPENAAVTEALTPFAMGK